MLRDLPTDQIIRRADARAVNSDTVSGLVESIGAVGLINPIRVRQFGVGWEVIAGVHRLEACKALGLAEVTCDVVAADDLHAELAMIDENLCRAELSPSDRARQTARRKAIYEELNPLTVNGTNQHTRDGQVVQPNFAKATSVVTGTDERTVRRDAERGQKILPEVLDMIRGTPLDTGSYMDKLKALPGSEQFRAAERDLAFLRSQDRQKAVSEKKIRLDADIKQRAAKACAELIAEYLPADAWDHFKSNLAVTTSKDLLTEFTNITGQSIMDRSAA